MRCARTQRVLTAALLALAGGLSPDTAYAELPSALQWSVTLYVTNAAVALEADRDCQGQRCAERYYSLVPVLGGLAQLSHAGVGFHDRHHGQLCAPLTVAAVAGQALGIAAHVAELPLALELPSVGRFELSVVPYVYEDGGSAAGLGLAWVR
jgi:hypothetical protein